MKLGATTTPQEIQGKKILSAKDRPAQQQSRDASAQFLQQSIAICPSCGSAALSVIHEVEGDILQTGAAAIAHGVAANDPMKQGLAAALHERYPAMHKDFHHWCRQQHPKPGSAWIWSGAGSVRLINLITQEGGYEHGSKPAQASVSPPERIEKPRPRVTLKKALPKRPKTMEGTPARTSRQSRTARAMRPPARVNSLSQTGVPR